MGGYSYLGQARSIWLRYPAEAPMDLQEAGPRELTLHLRRRQEDQQERRLLQKVIHGVHTRQVRRGDCDRKATNKWLTEGSLQARTEGMVMAAQDGVVHTRAYQVRIMGRGRDQACRRCGEQDETLGHILSACGKEKFGLIKHRHDKILHCLVVATMKALDIRVPRRLKKWGGGVRPGIYGTREARVLVDQVVSTARLCRNRRPDMVVRLAAEKRIVVFEVACAWDRLVAEREREKSGKYEELAADLARYWEYRVTIVPVVIGALGTVANLRKHLGRANILNKEQIEKTMADIQREALCAAVQMIRRQLTLDS